jgi:hypothetical protein
MDTQTDSGRAAAYIAALIDERDRCVAAGLDNRVRAIDDELRAVGADGAAPAKRAAKRPAAKKAAVGTR